MVDKIKEPSLFPLTPDWKEGPWMVIIYDYKGGEYSRYLFQSEKKAREWAKDWLSMDFFKKEQ